LQRRRESLREKGWLPFGRLAGQGVVGGFAPRRCHELRVEQSGSNGGNREDHSKDELDSLHEEDTGPQRGRKPKGIGFMNRMETRACGLHFAAEDAGENVAASLEIYA
jgi:hypothetical protein